MINEKTNFVFAVKTLALTLAVALIVLYTASAPRLISLHSGETPKDAVSRMETEPTLGFPLPFYIEGEILGGYPETASGYPFHLYLASPQESPGSGIDARMFFADFLIVFTPLFLLLLFLELKRKERYSKIAPLSTIKHILLLFLSSVLFVAVSPLFHPFLYYKSDGSLYPPWLSCKFFVCSCSCKKHFVSL